MALFRRRRPDVVLTMSPPLTLGLPAWVVARLRREEPEIDVELGSTIAPAADARPVEAAAWRFLRNREPRAAA